MKEVKFAVVGCGSIGSRHLSLVAKQPNARLVALCEIDEDKRRRYSDMYGGVPSYREYGDMLERAPADVVSVCTPHYLHAPMAIQAALAHRHCLVEKPMALHASDCDSMIEAARGSRVRLMVVKQNRFNVPVALTRRVLDEGRLGKVLTVQCNVIWNRHAPYYRESPWRGRCKYEGGALYTQVSHFVDLLIWWFGDVEHAQAHTARRLQPVEFEDCGSAILRFTSGVAGALFWTTCAFRQNFEGSVTIVAERGLIKIGGQYLNRFDHWEVEDCPLPPELQFVDTPNAYGPYQGTSSNHDKVIEQVVDDLLHDRDNSVNGEDAKRTVCAIEAIYRAAGQPVP